jgi:putative spermidine/putrescine transport system permease protein
MTWIDRLALAVMAGITALVAVFLMAPLAVAALVSFSSSPVFTLPAPSLTIAWYQQIAARPGFLPSLLLSIEVAAASTAVSLVLGTLAAIGLTRGRLPGKDAIAAFLMSPLMLPGLVIGIAMLQFLKGAGTLSVAGSLIAAHVVITMPYVMRTVLGALALFDFALIDAARTLGYDHPRAVLRVMVPALAPAFFAGGLFAFLASMDNYPVSIFFTDPRTKTLPIQMLQYLDERPDPIIAAISTCLIGLTVLVMLIGNRLVGLRRLAAL